MNVYHSVTFFYNNSKDGIFNGIINSDTKSISPLAVNFEEYNNQCKEEFENLFANN